MSEIMRPMTIDHLMHWIMSEYEQKKSIFGIEKLVKHENGQALPIFEEKIESPFGPAAGPNSQLAQNIVAAYAAGSRFFELKTVQVMDGAELAACINRPCIIAGDECYNCEWSTELYVPQAYAEYVKAWVACKLIAKEYGLGDPDGFVFNMSVGYDLEGIKSPKVDKYINDMIEAKDTEVFKECINWALEHVNEFKNVDEEYIRNISSNVSNSITESTLHGCPPAEIERIATYLITEKHLNTFIKCNPTLLGYEYARKRLDGLGFDYIAFDDHHFLEDLQWADAVPMLHRLYDLCQEKGLEFGVKITNTFPVDVTRNELPSNEMYMAGRALFPLSIHVARLLTDEFQGKLRISYSGGATIENIKELFDAGIWPITMATNILKPGGYQRMSQIADELMECGSERFSGVNVAALAAIDDGVEAKAMYKKPVKPLLERHVDKKLPLFDCFNAPCRNGCPIEQDIPAYLQAMVDDDAKKALEIILERNPLPFITGTICPHHCGDKCMRNYYEETLHIRETKLAAASQAYNEILPALKAEGSVAGKKVAIIGGGPAGLAAATFLSRAGVAVTVFERKEKLGGVVRNVIPEFRISADSIDKDVELCKAYGAEFKLGAEVTSVKALKAEGYTDVIVSIGAWKPGRSPLAYGEVTDALEFLMEAKKNGASMNIGKDVVVLGGGNTAMDVARAAKRIPGVEHVRLIYRRTKRYMPADEEELQLAIEDGVEFLELLAPVGAENGKLKCSVMELGAPDASGRRSPVDTGRTEEYPADTIIAAIGETIDTSLYAELGIEVDAKGRPVVDANMMTTEAGVYAVGDSRRGPATVVEAIADSAKAAAAIAGISYDKYAEENVAADEKLYTAKKGVQSRDTGKTPDDRCLGCPTVCEVCTDVCPNRANVAIHVPGKCKAQIIHVDGMCNECGNCEVFCPYKGGRPYKDKFTLYWSEEDFLDSTNEGFLSLGGTQVKVRLDGKVETVDVAGETDLPADAVAVIRTVLKDYAYLIR
ncbi:putative selenate reductase subunit YgfK [Clostridium sp. OM02-18AC]|uniref:putative selenate reductase subunit YgfK n=1 Tax=Clostridium sp. OM02-18AC TaxID=2292311 RepID=UPI000E4BD35A|nr:putative selenate reductase subunit YgfK [Clostridium sp. OM02-18AC]RHV67847.1 putative selenate reductase subunit YgfK [Clostridium sp. OM02-18AC]